MPCCAPAFLAHLRLFPSLCACSHGVAFEPGAHAFDLFQEALRLDKVIKSGFVFIWLEKELVSEVFRKCSFSVLPSLCACVRLQHLCTVRRFPPA